MAKEVKDPGLGVKYYQKARRIINKDGSFNVHRIGVESRGKAMYHWLLTTSWTNFLVMLIGLLLGINVVFAVVYFLIGVEHISGAVPLGGTKDFATTFFFSVQTFTTVGYGALSPEGMLTSMVASLEALTGLMISAMATGLLFARFSKPSANILYSESLLITPYRGSSTPSLQFRIANKRKNTLMEMEAIVIFAIEQKEEDGLFHRHYYELTLEIDKIHFFPLSWTIVHVIDADSPLYGVTKEEMLENEAEVLILTKGYDDSYGEVLHSRHSYYVSEFVWDKRFKRAYRVNKEGNFVMDLKDLHATEPIFE
ncbi:ion channel [Limibacter armeniacum]|uniref:ion channel n=1 Tax=Limibacter armeniacum TaxID=466084 RepID=UPI002FE527F2